MDTPPPASRFDELADLRQHEGLYYGACGHANLVGNIFGGQLMAQALGAATHHVEPDRALRSITASFLRAHPLTPTPRYGVETLLNGRSFTNLEVHVALAERVCFRASLCFQQPEDGVSHAEPMPPVEGPENLDDLPQLAARYRDRLSTGMGRVLGALQLYDLRPLDSEAFLFCRGRTPALRYWMRSRVPVGDSPRLHEAALIYMSDAWSNSPMLLPHVDVRLSRSFFAPSLSHSLWLHRVPDVNQWLLFDLHSPALQSAAGLVNGNVYDRQGQLVASLAQQALFRMS